MVELHSIKKFRGTNLGIIRLNNLAKTEGIKIKIGDEYVVPVSYDTYGHPIISEQSFNYYRALKAIKERQYESLVPEVKYEEEYFSIGRNCYDSKEAFEKLSKLKEEDQLSELKKILIYRKKAHFIGKELNTYILYGRYAIYKDGHIYMCSYDELSEDYDYETVMDLSEVKNLKLLEEVHIPGAKDRCAICGKKFHINEIKSFSTTENEKGDKVHTDCLKKCTEAVNYQRASRIVDTVYINNPSAEIIREYDKKEGTEKVWYKYHTVQGDVGIRFKKKVIEIRWFGNFKPFNLEILFKDEDVTKRKLEDSKVIHAWSSSDAIKYLMKVEKL